MCCYSGAVDACGVSTSEREMQSCALTFFQTLPVLVGSTVFIILGHIIIFILAPVLSVEDSFRGAESYEALKLVLDVLAPDLLRRLESDRAQHARRARTLVVRYRHSGARTMNVPHGAPSGLDRRPHPEQPEQRHGRRQPHARGAARRPPSVGWGC